MSRKQKVALIISAIFLIAATPVVVVGRHVFHRQRNIRNWVDVNLYRSAIEDFTERHGRLPATVDELEKERKTVLPANHQFAEGRDSYGQKMFYQSRGTAFILVSFGSDGRPETGDYWRLRGHQEPYPATKSSCSQPGVDIICSDLSCYRSCGK